MTTDKPRVHFVAPYLTNPVHRISVNLIGAGGSGSQMLSALARIDCSLRALGHKGLYVTVYDPDTVEQTNVGRQLFGPRDIGLNKADCLVTRFNRFYGLDWQSEPRKFDKEDNLSNIVITCVDNIAARKMVGKMFPQKFNAFSPEFGTFYWLDLGNGQCSGQAVLGSCMITQPKSRKYEPVGKLPLATEEFDYSTVDEKDSGPSCSLAEALSKQDLFINSTLVQMAGSLLWTLLREPVIDTRGFYLNLDTFRTSPIHI